MPLSRRRPAKTISERVDEVREYLVLADLYMNDGALHAAATLYSKAGQSLRLIAKHRDELIDNMVKKGSANDHARAGGGRA